MRRHENEIGRMKALRLPRDQLDALKAAAVLLRRASDAYDLSLFLRLLKKYIIRMLQAVTE